MMSKSKRQEPRPGQIAGLDNLRFPADEEPDMLAADCEAVAPAADASVAC